MTELALRTEDTDVNGAYRHSTDTIYMRILPNHIYTDTVNGEYVNTYDKANVKEVFNLYQFIIYLLNHEYNHAVLSKTVSREASRQYDNISEAIRTLSGIDM